MSPDAIRKKLKEIDQLPDDSIIPDPVVAKIMNIGLRTLRRSNPVRRVQLSPGRIGRRLGEVRALIRGDGPFGRSQFIRLLQEVSAATSRAAAERIFRQSALTLDEAQAEQIADALREKPA